MKQKSDRGQKVRDHAPYSLLGEFSDTVLFLYDYGEERILFTPNIEREFRYDPDAAQQKEAGNGKPWESCGLLHPEDCEAFRSMLEGAGKDGEEQCMEVRFRDRGGSYRWMSCEGHRFAEGDSEKFVGKLTDIQKQKNRERGLVYRASVDKMTGALNRETTELEISRLLRLGRPGTLFMIDVDEFKAVNDSLGHFKGDSLLIYIVEEMKREFRREDIIGRVGGDEFMIFVPELTEQNVAGEKAEILLKRFAKWTEMTITASIGIASAPENGTDYIALYESADAALYHVKRQGKNGYFLVEHGKNVEK